MVEAYGLQARHFVVPPRSSPASSTRHDTERWQPLLPVASWSSRTDFNRRRLSRPMERTSRCTTKMESSQSCSKVWHWWWALSTFCKVRSRHAANLCRPLSRMCWASKSSHPHLSITSTTTSRGFTHSTWSGMLVPQNNLWTSSGSGCHHSGDLQDWGC